MRGYKDSTSYVWDETKDALKAEVSADLDVDDLRYITALVRRGSLAGHTQPSPDPALLGRCRCRCDPRMPAMRLSTGKHLAAWHALSASPCLLPPSPR